MVPQWVSRSGLDEPGHIPGVRAGEGDALRAAAQAHAEADRPATAQERRDILRALRMGTMARNEHPDEARLSFEKLNADLADVPADILRSACSAYVNEPGTRFFPRSAGEIRTFSNPMHLQRKMRADKLNRMAVISDEMVSDRWKPEPGETARILAEAAAEAEAKRQARAGKAA